MRAEAAASPAADTATLERLARDSDSDVRAGAARNLACLNTTLGTLTRDDASLVSATGCLANPNATPQTASGQQQRSPLAGRHRGAAV